ncbi:GAF domain-containing protein [Caldisalinibacter kiritimatiensis]|uniref:GAF domain-containing protein n=1 Tax=Caldisalinibacter kiritimatiensis TaxID=1304284 RepID=R1AUJ1_9FIRM|nr:hypothetical protein L21TH_1104 [Caldisalinibacter kiritimatiensis]
MSNIDSSITSKLYRYEALLQAIDFFTQRFDLEQLSNFAFEFANEILTLKSSALFISEDDNFVLKNRRNYSIDSYSVENDSKIQLIATLHGTIITTNLQQYFSPEFIRKFRIRLVIPLIIDDKLYGFIVSDGKAIGECDESDYVIAKTLMRLFNNSLENSKIFSELKTKNNELDEKIFNLFAINQSSKMLLSELNLENLYTIATDVFGEITSSKVTSFGIYNDTTNTIQIKGYRNVSTFSKYFTELKFNSNSYTDNKIVLDINEDIEIIKSLFINWEELLNLDAKYIILLVKEKLLGLVTLSEPVTNSTYKQSIFELIETLASFTYIALSNAMLFEEIKQQKKIIEKKFKTLVNLNKLVNNINHCTSIDELFELTLKALNISFGIKKAFIALRDNEKVYKIKDSKGVELRNYQFSINKHWEDTFSGETIYDFTESSCIQYFNEELYKGFGKTNCTVISPIIVENYSLSYESYPLGYLVVLKTKDSLQEEEILLLDTITKNISPVIYQMNIREQIQELYIEDPKKKFLDVLSSKIKERNEYLLDFNLYYKKVNKHPFEEVELHEYKGLEHYIVDNYVFVFTYEDLKNEELMKIPTPNTIDEFLNYQF